VERSIRMRIPGESRDPLINDSVGGTVGPGFRRECDLNWFCYRSMHYDLGFI
jgi:hypothetical protein